MGERHQTNTIISVTAPKYRFFEGTNYRKAARIPEHKRKEAIAKARETRLKNKSEINVRKNSITKTDEREYCLLVPEYAELHNKISDLIQKQKKGIPTKGLSAMQTARAKLKAKILQELPNGPVLEALGY